MADTSYYDLYKALKADGAVQGDWNSFHKFVGAQGKQGYLNRKKLYDALKADGAVQASTYEEFNNRLFRGGQASLRAAQQRQAAQKPQQPQTAAQRALQMLAPSQNNEQPQQVDYLSRPQSQMPKYGKAPSGKVSPFVQALYSEDNARRSSVERPYTMPTGKKEDSSFVQNVRQRNQRQQQFMRGASSIEGQLAQYEQQMNQPIVDTGSPEANQSIVKTQEQLMQEMQESGKNFVDSNLGGYIDDAINQEFKDAHKRGLQAEGNDYFQHGTGGADWYVGERKYQQQVDPDAMIKNLSQEMSAFTQNPEFIKQVEREAASLGISPEEYAKNSVLPSLLEKTSSKLMNEDVMRRMPKSTLEYITGGILNSMTGALLTGLTTSKQQRQNQQQADAMTEDGKNPNYQPGTWAKAGRGTVAFVADAPAFAAGGVGAKAVTSRVFGNAAQQMAKMANKSLLQKVGMGIGRGVVHGGALGFQYGAFNGAVQNYSTGEDTSLGGTLKATLMGGLSEAASFAAMEGMGGIVGAVGHKVGLRGNERGFWQQANKLGQKVTFEAIKTGFEGLGMATGGVASSAVRSALTGEDFHGFTVEGTLESCASAAVFKLMHAKDLFKKEVGRDGKPLNYKQSIAAKVSRFLASDELKGASYVFTPEEKYQLFNAGASVGMKPMADFVNWAKQAKKYNKAEQEMAEDGQDVLNYYQQIMQDPSVSWDAKAKFTTLVMGTMPSSRPMMDHVSFDTEEGTDKDNSIHVYKTINEYAADGTLLSKVRYDTRDKRDSAIYEINIRREAAKLWNAMALLEGLDKNDLDLQNAFFKEKAKNWEDVDDLLYGMETQGSTIDKEYGEYVRNHGRIISVIEEVAKQSGLTRDELIRAFQKKDPMKRTDVEQTACLLLRKEFEKAVFPETKPHPEQSAEDGKDVVTENNLGTEQPNNQAVLDNLHGLTEAENEMEQLMISNDIFSDNFKSLQQQGLTHPQIYDWMIKNGMTEEQLAPYAHYMNAVAKVQGMQNATAQAIEECVGMMAQDWGFHGTMDGEKADGSQVLYVQDRDGRTLIVGSGDVSYDPTDGHAKEGVGDMLVCLDPNTRETVYVRAEDTTLFQTQDVEAFKNEERQRLQQINSVPYNQAAQEQAAAEAAKPQQKEVQPKETVADGEQSGQPQQEQHPSAEQQKPSEQPSYPTDENGEPDFAKMSPEEGAQLYRDSFNDPEAQVARDVKAAEKALKDAQKMQPKGDTFNGKKQSQQVINETIKAAEEQLRVVRDIQKSMTAQKVAETVGKPEGAAVLNTEGMDEATKRFIEAPKVEGRHGTITLPNGEKISGTYYAVPAMSLIPSHDPFNDYKPHEGVPLDENGRTINDRDYYNDKDAQDNTNEDALDYDGRAISDIPVVNPDGRVISGNGRTMAGQLAAVNGKDGKYIESMVDNAAGFGMKTEDLDKLDHARIIFVPDEPLPYTTDTFAKFNRDDKKSQSNTEQAVTKSKTLTADEVGSIIAEIDGDGSLDAFFNNPKAINDLIKTLVSKSIIGQKEVAKLKEGEDRLSSQGKDLVKNLLLGSIFKPETIRMLGIDSAIKNKAIAGIRAVMDNLKLGDYSLRDEIDQAIQLLYEARRGGNKVDTLLRTPEMFGENAASRYPSISQMMALALEGKVADFRDLLNEYNRQAAARNTGEGNVFGDTPTKEELIRDFLNYKKWVDYDTRGNSEAEGGNDAEGVRKTEPEAQGGNGERNDEWYNQSAAKLATAKGEERKQILHGMGEYVKDYAKKNGFDEPAVYDTWDDFEKDFPGAKEDITGGIDEDTCLGGFSNGKRMFFVMEDRGVYDINDVKESLNHEATHVDNTTDPSRKEAVIASVKDFKTVKLTDLMNAIEYVAHTDKYTEIANNMLAEGMDPTEMLAEEFLANAVEEIYRKGEDVVTEITSNPTLQKLALDAYKFRENDRRGKERLSEGGNPADRNVEKSPVQDSKKASRSNVQTAEGKQESDRDRSDENGRENVEGRGGNGEKQADKLAGVESDAEQKIDDYIAEHYPHHNGVRARTKEEQAAYDAETEAMKNDETLKQMRKEADEAFDEAKTDKIKILPEEDNTPDDPTNPFETIAKAADDFKKDHPMTEEEIMAVDGLDDEAKYTAIDYLNGEDDSEVARICYEQAYAKRGNHTTKSGENVPQSGENHTTSEKKDTTRTTNPMETIEKAAADYESEKGEQKPSDAPKTIAEKKAAAKKLKEESDKKTLDLMNQFLAAKDEKKDGSGKALSTLIPIPSKALKWMDRNLTLTDKQKEILPKLLTAIKGSMYARIKEGIYNLEDVIENVRKDFKTFFDALDKDDANKILAEAAYKGRFTDPETGERIKLSEAAEREKKMTPEHKKNLVGDSKDAEDRKQKENKFINRIQLVITLSKFKTGIVGLRKIAEDCGLKDIKDTDLQELAETAVVMRARDIANSKATSDEVKFKQIKRLYDNQPSLNQRDSERVLKQQYSTPAPYAFLADMYLKGNGKVINSALEPSAGNGALTIGLPKDNVHVNDIDEARLMNLHRQGFKNITSQDGTQPFADKNVDVVVTNPPFGSSTPKDYDGYRISSLEGQMAINALESMKDDGRAAIIIGGKTEYAKNGSLMPKDKAFLGYLYSHYNVEDVINVDGSLYAKQGTSYPTRIILINGRRLDENSFPPVRDKARAETVKDYDELYKRINDDILRGRGVDTSIRNERRNVEPELDRQGSKDTSEKGVRVREHRGGKQTASVLPDGLHEESSVSGTNDALGDERGAEREVRGNLLGGTSGGDGAGANASESERRAANADGGNGGQQPEPRGAGRHAAQPSTDGTSISRSGGRLAVEQQKKEEKRDLSSEKVTYSPKSGNPFTLQSVMPADQQEAVNKNLAKLGDADQFLVDELGYNDKDDLYKHLAAEQVDAVALAIHQAKQGNAFIIGDMTGIGKGRQAASLIRYAKKQGQIPVYFTQKAMLLSDVYRDLVDIGNPELRPFIFGRGSDFNVTDAEGNLVYKYPSEKEVKRVLDYIDKNGTLPKEYDYVLTTYSQVGNGIYEYGEDGTRKERKIAKGKKFDSGALNGQQRRDAIEKLIGNGYLIMDESHTVAGESGVGNYFQHIIQKAKNVTFFSATFAKRPDNMPIYALRTAMNQGGLKASDLIDAVKRGGATLQEIMSQTLTKCGQMIRRERDMTGVTIDWKAIDDPEKVEEQRAQYDSIIGLFNDIINFQKTYVSEYVESRNKELAAVQASMGIKRGTAALGIKNTPFASKAFNTVQQVLLSLKAKSAAERAVEYLKQGMKPVIALNNTNESQTDNIAIGEEMDAPDLGSSLKKGLEGTLRYTQKDAKNNSESGYIKLSDLGDEAVSAYHELEKKIEQTSTGLSLSPIDVIKNELEKAGYKVGELTGRQTEFVYNDNGTVTKVKRTNTDKKKIAREFNDGQIDALILNKSAATGISLHASSKFKDQRKRVMIVAQQQLDVNDEVQMRGRIDRTGQILRGAYEYVVSLIPAEQRLLMMFKAKLKSLDANTTSSQKSKFNEMEVADITNKYGDKVVREYMAEHLDLYSRMADPFGWEDAYGDDIAFVDPQKLATTRVKNGNSEAGSDASKLLGRMALLKVAEQEKMLQEISDLYAAEINRLNEMGENDLEITELPLKAKTIGREVWKQGTEPDGNNAFADNTYIEKVNMAILKKPMKAQEVQKAQEGLTGGRSWDEYRDSKKAEVKNYFDQKIADATQKNEERAVKLATAAKEKYMKDAKRGQKDSGMSDEQIEQMAGYQYDNIYKEEKDKLKEIVKNIKAKADAFERVLDTFNTEDAYVLPADMNNPNEMSSFGNSYGRLIDIKITDNFSPNASSVSFATLDGRRKITFPVSGKVGAGENKADIISAIYRMTQQASSVGDKHLRVLSMDTANWDRLVSNESRKDGYIITGNLMQALIDTKAQGVGGQLVKYTTDGGDVKTGILMPDRFEPKDVSVEAPISSVEDKFHKRLDEGGIESIKSSDGEVEIIQKYNHYDGDFEYQIRVPKSQKRGGKYFLDKDLCKMMGGGNFETRGNSMLGEFKERNLHNVLARLSNLGVKVREERKSSEEEGTHFRTDRSVQYSKTDEKDVKNSRIIPEDVDKSVSSQIEKDYNDFLDKLLSYGKNEKVKGLWREYSNMLAKDFSKMSSSQIEKTIKKYEEAYINGEHGGADLQTPDHGRSPSSDKIQYGIALNAAERELRYRDDRQNRLESHYGLKAGEGLTYEGVERIFEESEGAKDKDLRTLFNKAESICKRCGVEFRGEATSEDGNPGTEGITTTGRKTTLFIDSLARTSVHQREVGTTLVHEMLHTGTMGAIHLVKSGKAEGVLTPKQIEAVKTVLDVYDKAIESGKITEADYGIADEYEFAAQMADPAQRTKLSKPLAFGERLMAAARELKKRGDIGLWNAIKNAWDKLFHFSDKDKVDKALNDIFDDFYKPIDDLAMDDIREHSFAKKVEDKDELDRLNKEKTFRMYSGMQEVDGKLYSPMAAIIGGERTDATEMGAWMKADERPDLVKNGKFTLVKTDKAKGLGEGDVDAAYNPYMHTSTSMMNDQFTGAYARGNIKVVEWEIPESEKTSGYRAEGAKDAVGLVPWHSGSVNSLLPKDRQRQVMLSQYRKAVRVVPDSEVAESIAQQLKGTGLAIPWNVVTPNQVKELAKLGVPITTVESGKQATETKAKFEAQMEELKQEYPQAKFVDVKMTKDAFKQWGKDGGTHFREDSAARIADDAPVVVKHVDKIAKKLGAKVNMVQSIGEITNKSARAAIERGEKVTGWYDEKTGEVHLYMPNIHNRYTAEKTIWHEVVGHKGMRELFGDENYSKFLRSLWYDLDKAENARLKELVSEELKYNPLDFENGIEEGIARLVEDGRGEQGFWNNIKNKVTDILHEIGYRIAPNTKDVKYLLWLSKNLQKNPNDMVWKMRAEAVRYKLDRENTPAMIAKDGVFYTNDGKARSLNDLTKKEFDEATDGQIHFRTTPSAATALDRYHKSLDEHGYMFTESYMDNMLSLKNLMQAIVPDAKNIVDIKSSENPYMLQNTMQGAMSDAAKMFERNVMKPLDKAMAEVLDAFGGKFSGKKMTDEEKKTKTNDDDKIKNFNLYMITKHGLERNRILFMRDTLDDMRKDEKQKKNVDVIEKDWYDELADLNERLDRGDIDLKGYFDGIDDFIRLEVDSKFDAGKHDYSGIHAIQGIKKSSDPYDDAEAIASVMDAEASMEGIKKGSVKAYWDKVNAATQYAIDTDYKNGLISKELHGHVSEMFNWYVPLRKYDEATAEDTYGYITEKGDPKNFIGSTIMRARGHKYLSETNVLAQIGAMGNRAIKNGGQNAIKQAFARFIRNHSDNNLVTETSVWYVDDPVTQTTKERYPDIPEDATPDEVNQIVSDFNAEMRDLESKGLASKVRRRGRIGYKFERAENRSQHIVDVKIAGKTHSFVINGNPRAAQALNGLLENSKARVPILGTISRMMAQLCTSYNPEFVMRNIMRDAEFASSNVTAKEGARYGAIWAKYYAQLGLYKGASTISMKDFAGTTGLGLFAKYRNGTLDTSDKIQRYFKEFMENGGETGWVQIKNMKEWEKQYKDDVKNERSKIQKGGAAVRDFFFGNLENLNEVAENIARFATYCASRDSNRTVIRSVYDAKEVSTNFNRHGSGRAIYSFKNGDMSLGKRIERSVDGFLSGYLRHYSMFFNAGIQSTNLLVKNLKTNPVGTSINMLSIPFALGALAALGNNALIASEDEKDRNGVKDPYGELPDYVRRNNLCIYKGGGEFITIPLAIELRAFYGLGDLAAGLTFSPNVSGQKNPYFDAIGCMSQLVPVMDYLGNSSAGKEPLNETIKAISPSAIAPFVEWEMNSDWKGAPIERRGDWNENSPAWQRAYNGTPEWLKDINKWVNAQTNDVAKGNEDMLGNGFLDMVTNPSMINHFFGGIGGGAATFVERTAGLIKNGKDTETKDIPFVRSLLYTPSEQTSLQRTKSKWYNYVDEMETTMANVDRLKSKNVPIDKRLQNMADYYHFQDSSDAAKVRIIELSQKQMKQWKKMRDRATDTESVKFANQNIDRIMMEAVDELDKME